MSVTYEEFEKAELKTAEAESRRFAAARRRVVQEQVARLSTATDQKYAAKAEANAATNRVIGAEAGASHAKAALQAAANRRRFRRQLSERGLSQSGLSQAVAARVNAAQRLDDREITAAAREEQRVLSAKLADWLAAAKTAEEKEAARLTASAENEILRKEAALYKAARTRATAQYKAALAAQKKEGTGK